MISATVVLDSVSPFSGHRLTTMVVVMPRIILAEFNTHRAFSRNSASSRAIPVKKLIERVRTDPFIPKVFTVQKPGMSSNEPVRDQELARSLWKQAAMKSANVADELRQLDVHKQHANRLLEPFLWHTVLVSSTEWENFFAQRCDPGAQPEMQETALAMQMALLASVPETRIWHYPFIQAEDRAEVDKFKLISAGRCAVVSYDNLGVGMDSKKDIERALKLKNATPPHYSPAEHVAAALPGRHANFNGWRQLRWNWEQRL